MGYMTEVSILNDRWDEIRKSPAEFVEQLYMSSITSGRIPAYIIGQTEVAKTHHADDIRVYFSGENSFIEAYPDRSMDLRRLRQQLAILKEMKTRIKYAELETKELIAKGEESEAKQDSDSKLPQHF